MTPELKIFIMTIWKLFFTNLISYYLLLIYFLDSNTSDEMDILHFLADNIKLHQDISNKNIKMITIVNKADYMQLGPNDDL